MKYYTIDTSKNDYPLILKEDGFYNKYNAGKVLIEQINKYFPNIINFKTISFRNGNSMREELLECHFNIPNSSNHPFYIYAIQIEGGGRSNLPYEQRLQIRQHSLWNPDLNTLGIANKFIQAEKNKENVECYVIGIYKTSETDDVIFSGFYPNVMMDVELTAKTPTSKQLNIKNIQEAYLYNISCQDKGKSDGYPFKIINFKPQYIFWYMENRDQLHLKDIEEAKRLCNQIVEIPLNETNTIYYGAPGTGKTHKMQKDYISKYAELDKYITTFHQSFSYEEFVESLKPKLEEDSRIVNYHIEKGIFFRACERAAVNAGYSSLKSCIEDTLENRKANFKKAIEENKTVLLCIDEINRGNVASIFGDLISLIEPSKRLGTGELEMTATLPYSKQVFGVPANLIIVGTMNTSDRSIQLLDSALRRRFKFVELSPNYDVIENEDAKNVLKNINARIRCLLNKDNQIGHSYFMYAENSCDILSALYNKIIPLLEEYFYNDMDKVRFVIGDNSSINFYIEDTDAKKAYESYLSNSIEDEEKEFYKFNPAIIEAIESKNEEDCKSYLVNLIK